MDIDVSELNNLAADLGKASAKTTLKAAAVVTKTAHDIERDGKALAPVDTGALRSSISATVSGLHAEIGPTVEYAQFVEEGTSVMGPQPYMGPAAARHTPGFVTALEQLSQDIL